MSGARASSTMSNDLLPLLVAALGSAREVAGVVEAALDRGRLRLRVDEVPEPGVRYAIELSCPGLTRPVAMLAMLAEPTQSRDALLALRPMGAQGEADLRAFLDEHASRPLVEQPADDPFRGRLLGGGKYEVESLISSGAAGRVYRARHLLLDRPIAIKLLHTELANDAGFTAHFHGEARAACRLDHPNICRVFDFGQDDDGLLYIVMELLEGAELTTLVEKEGPFPLPTIVDYVSQVCAALSLAHDRGIVHRDVKAENIVAVTAVDDDGQPMRRMKVCDFGLAMSTDLSSGEQFANFLGTCGTPAYMPPEQVRGQALDARTDVYACGVLLYLLATGKLPFDDDDPRRILSMQLTHTPTPPSALNPKIDLRLERIIQKAMSKERGARHANARELRNDLKAMRERADSQRTDPTPTATAPVSSRGPESQRRDFHVTRARVRLEDPASGLAALVEALRRFVAAPGQAPLLELSHVLEGRDRLSLFRSEAGSADLMVTDPSTPPRLLAALAPAPAAGVLAQALARRGILALTVREGIEAGEASTLLDSIRAPQPASLRSAHGLLLTESARLGRHRALPWSVDLVASQLSMVLADGDRAGREREVAAVLRLLPGAAEARQLLESSDLVGAVAQCSAWDVACAIAAGLEHTPCAQLLASLAQELLQQSAAVPVDLVRLLARRLSADRRQSSDELLRMLLARSVLSPEDVPAELRIEKLAEQCAADLVASPVRALSQLDSLHDESAYAAQLGVVEEAMRILVTQGRLTAFAHAFRTLAAHAADGAHPFRAPIATRAIAGLQDPAFLERVALVLMRGAAASHEAAQSVLVVTGAHGAQALCNVRNRLGNELDLGARKRFAMTLKAIGSAAFPAISRALRTAGPDSLDVFSLEDVLRAVPEGASDDVGATVHRLTQHFAPQVRRAALGALTAIWGQRVRPTLISALSDQDEGVRLSSLIGLQRVGGLDAAAVQRVDELLIAGSDEVRAAAAAALGGAAPAARPAAAAALTRVLLSKSKISRVFRLGADEDGSAIVLEAAARALLAVDPVDGSRVVEQRARAAEGELKRRLLAQLTR